MLITQLTPRLGRRRTSRHVRARLAEWSNEVGGHNHGGRVAIGTAPACCCSGGSHLTTATTTAPGHGVAPTPGPRRKLGAHRHFPSSRPRGGCGTLPPPPSCVLRCTGSHRSLVGRATGGGVGAGIATWANDGRRRSGRHGFAAHAGRSTRGLVLALPLPRHLTLRRCAVDAVAWGGALAAMGTRTSRTSATAIGGRPAAAGSTGATRSTAPCPAQLALCVRHPLPTTSGSPLAARDEEACVGGGRLRDRYRQRRCTVHGDGFGHVLCRGHRRLPHGRQRLRGSRRRSTATPTPATRSEHLHAAPGGMWAA